MLTSPARLSRPCRLAGPAHPAATAGFSIPQGEIPRETDCLLEGDGFELPVRVCLSPPPPCRPRTRAVASGRWRTGGHTSPSRTDPARADNQHFVGHSFSTHPQSWSGLNGIV